LCAQARLCVTFVENPNYTTILHLDHQHLPARFSKFIPV
jgi:hypothetical protein